MKHLLRLSNNWYVSDVDQLDEEELSERLTTFANEGTPSIIFNDWEDLAELGLEIEEEDVTVVELG